MTKWSGVWLGGWQGGGSSGEPGGFADGAAIGGGSALGRADLRAFVSLSALGAGLGVGIVGLPQETGGRRFYPRFAPVQRLPRAPAQLSRRRSFAFGSCVGVSRSRGFGAAETLFDVNGKIARRAFIQRRNLALALAA